MAVWGDHFIKQREIEYIPTYSYIIAISGTYLAALKLSMHIRR